MADGSGRRPFRAFADIGSHLLDLIEFITGQQVTRLVSQTWIVHGTREGQEVSN